MIDTHQRDIKENEKVIRREMLDMGIIGDCHKTLEAFIDMSNTKLDDHENVFITP